MAQGQVKKKGGKTNHKSYSKKASGPKKGARIIKPKKSKHVRVAKLKMTLEKSIKLNIEQELAGQAVSRGSQKLNMVKLDTDDKSADKKKGKQKKIGR